MRQKDSLTDRIGGELYGSLTEYERTALQYVYGRGAANVSGLADYMGRSVKVSRNTLKALVNKGVLVWHGTSQNDPSQYYSLP